MVREIELTCKTRRNYIKKKSHVLNKYAISIPSMTVIIKLCHGDSMKLKRLVTTYSGIFALIKEDYNVLIDVLKDTADVPYVPLYHPGREEEFNRSVEVQKLLRDLSKSMVQAIKQKYNV